MNRSSSGPVGSQIQGSPTLPVLVSALSGPMSGINRPCQGQIFPPLSCEKAAFAEGVGDLSDLERKNMRLGLCHLE